MRNDLCFVADSNFFLSGCRETLWLCYVIYMCNGFPQPNNERRWMEMLGYVTPRSRIWKFKCVVVNGAFRLWREKLNCIILKENHGQLGDGYLDFPVTESITEKRTKTPN